MLVQPYVENAIKHGLAHKEGPKKLDIHFWIENQQLVCQVKDNGIGREKAKQIKANNARYQSSRAMNLTQARIAMLNSYRQSKLSIMIEDLKNKDGTVGGTNVLLYIHLHQLAAEPLPTETILDT